MVTDILFDQASGDLLIKGGDLVIGESTQQHQYDIIVADKGHYHHDPTIGVGATRFLLDRAAMPGLVGTIRVELDRDGQEVEQVAIGTNGQIQISASYPA